MLGLGEFYLREKQEPEFETKLDRLCFSYSVSQPAVTLSSTERWWFVGNNEYYEITALEQITDRPGLS